MGSRGGYQSVRTAVLFQIHFALIKQIAKMKLLLRKSGITHF